MEAWHGSAWYWRHGSGGMVVEAWYWRHGSGGMAW